MLISESHNQTSHAHFWPHPSKKIFDLLLLNVDLYQLEKKNKKSDYFIYLFWRYGWLKNLAIWLAENILVHILGTKIYGICVEHSK